jgi:hypothetical protein
MKYHVKQIQPYLIILNSFKREMETLVFLNGKIRVKIVVFSLFVFVPLKSCTQAGPDIFDASHCKLSECVQKFSLSIS